MAQNNSIYTGFKVVYFMKNKNKMTLFLLRHVTNVTAVYFSSIIEHEGQWCVQNIK
jgi:hypothetical protein